MSQCDVAAKLSSASLGDREVYRQETSCASLSAFAAMPSLDARGAPRETICNVSPAARAFTTTLSAINFDKSPFASRLTRSGCAAPSELAGRLARNSFARSRLLSISKRKAYPESHCGKKDGAASACLCSNTRAMAFRSKDKLSASRSVLSFADFAGAANFTAYKVSGEDAHSLTFDC